MAAKNHMSDNCAADGAKADFDIFVVPRLETARTWLRPWSVCDTKDYARILRDPQVTRYLGCGLKYSAKRALASVIAMVSDVEARWGIHKLMRHWQRWGFGEWAVEEKASGELIGRIGLTHHPTWIADNAKVEIGWLLARNAWGRGLATEGARACLGYAFGSVKLQRIVSITQILNVRSQAVMQRIGLVRTGQTHWRGCEVVWYSMDRASWEQAAARGGFDGTPREDTAGRP